MASSDTGEDGDGRRAVDRYPGIAENALSAMIGAAGGLSLDPEVVIASAAGGVVLAAVLRREVTALLDHFRAPRANHFAAEVVNAAGLTPHDFIQHLTNDPAAAELFAEGLELAQRTMSEMKRRHLAKVVAAALAPRPDETRLDPLPILLRTVAALEPIEVRALVKIATPHPAEGQMRGHVTAGYLSADELAVAVLPEDQADLIGPILSRLTGESLIVDVSSRGGLRASYDGPRWSLAGYGERFLRYLPDDYGLDELGQAELAVALDTGGRMSPPVVAVQNLGPGLATIVSLEATTAAGSILRDCELPRALEAHEQFRVGTERRSGEAMTIRVRWRDTAGRTLEREVRYPDVNRP